MFNCIVDDQWRQVVIYGPSPHLTHAQLVALDHNNLILYGGWDGKTFSNVSFKD